jgi:hypothetical protein
MNYEGKDLVATGAELVAASSLIGEAYGSLSRLPRSAAHTGGRDCGEGISRPVVTRTPHRHQRHDRRRRQSRPRWHAALHVGGCRGAPQHPRLASAHGAGMDFHVLRRHTLAPAPAHTGRPAPRAHGGAAGIRIPLRSSPYRCCLNTSSSLLFLGILHLLQAAHLQACLSHVESPLSFDPGVLPDVMHEGGTEDFRWPLYFFDKVLPHSVEIMPWAEELAPALADLVAHDLIKPDGADYRLTMNGFAFAAGFRHHLTKVGLRFTSQNAADIEAHEAVCSSVRRMTCICSMSAARRARWLPSRSQTPANCSKICCASVPLWPWKRLRPRQQLRRPPNAPAPSAARVLPWTRMSAPPVERPPTWKRLPHLRRTTCGHRTTITAKNTARHHTTAVQAVRQTPCQGHVQILRSLRRTCFLIMSNSKPAFCSNCGAALAPGTAFCDQCGHRVAAASASPSPSPSPSPSAPIHLRLQLHLRLRQNQPLLLRVLPPRCWWCLSSSPPSLASPLPCCGAGSSHLPPLQPHRQTPSLRHTRQTRHLG